MKLYYSPGVCSMIVRMVLTQIGAPFEAIAVDLAGGQQRTPEYLALNPKGKVPVLVRDDGSVLTEVGTIVLWLGNAYPEHQLIPLDLEARSRMQEAIDYCIGTLHIQGVMRVFTPSVFGEEHDHAAIQNKGRQVIAQGLEIMSGTLTKARYLAGSHMSVADFVFFCIAFAAAHLEIPLPPAVQRHYDQMSALPSVYKSLAAEGFA